MLLGFQLFSYLSHCPNDNDGTAKTLQYYIDVFNHDSPGAIIEAALEIKNIDSSKKIDNECWQMSSSEKLIEKLNALLTLEFNNFDILMSAQSDQTSKLASIKDGQLRNSLKDCPDERQCQELRKLVEHLGNFY